MLPPSLKSANFDRYPAPARDLAVAHLPVLQHLPLAFLASLLREILDSPEKFPVEQAAIRRELKFLSSLDEDQRDKDFAAFRKLRITPALEAFDWINEPAQFLEKLSAYLWSTHQLDAYRDAATAYGDRLRAAAAPPPPALPRLGIAVIGQGVSSSATPLFRRLRQHGTYFTNVEPEHGLERLLAAAAKRAEAHPEPYAHWYVDGGAPAEHSSALTMVSYQAMTPVRNALLKNIDGQVTRPGMGPEELHTYLARLAPADLGMHGDAVLARFQLSLLTEGSGTQIFSTTFAQWTAREVLRRAEALTLLVRFAPRQRQRPMNELLSSEPTGIELDPTGSLADADMAAYYHWINQQRLPGAEHSSFLAWFEGHGVAMAISPTTPRGVQSHSRVDLRSLVSLVLG